MKIACRSLYYKKVIIIFSKHNYFLSWISDNSVICKSRLSIQCSVLTFLKWIFTPQPMITYYQDTSLTSVFKDRGPLQPYLQETLKEVPWIFQETLLEHSMAALALRPDVRHYHVRRSQFVIDHCGDSGMSLGFKIFPQKYQNELTWKY